MAVLQVSSQIGRVLLCDGMATELCGCAWRFHRQSYGGRTTIVDNMRTLQKLLSVLLS